MKYIRYSRYTSEAADDIDLQDLMNRLSDFFLQSGFDSPYGIYEMDMDGSQERRMDQLREAIKSLFPENQAKDKEKDKEPGKANEKEKEAPK